MSESFPDYLFVPPERLGKGTGVTTRIVPGAEGVARHMAQAMLEVILEASRQGREATLIVPVGPVDQFSLLVELINQQRVDCRDVMFINMDEYLDNDDQWVPETHPLSFRGYMNRSFYDLLDPAIAPRKENRVFPHPHHCGEMTQLIEDRGGVDACFGGIGINSHVAFNEPPDPSEACTVEDFAARATRVLTLSRETRTINSVTVGGEISIVPCRAVTVGMVEILASRSCRFYCNRPWQRAVVRRVLHGPLSAECPASLLRMHHKSQIVVADFVAEIPDIQLR